MPPALAGFVVWIAAAAWWAFLLAYDVFLPWWAMYVAPVVLAYLVLRLIADRR